MGEVWTMREIPSGFRTMQIQCGIWRENLDAFLADITPREGQEDAYSAMADLMEHKSRIVILTGESRSGKSFLLSGYINDCIRERWGTEGQDNQPKYMTFFDMELALRAAQTKGTMDILFRDLVKVPQIAFDEVGRGKWSEFTSTFFTNLLIRRYGEKRETVMATNLNGQELVGMMDLALIRRLKENRAIVKIKKV